MKPFLWSGIVAILLPGAGCGDHSRHDQDHDHDAGHGHGEHAHAGHDKDHEDHDDHAEGTHAASSFKEGKGLTFSDETKQALGLATAKVETRSLAQTIQVTAQVFATGEQTLASASVPSALAGRVASDKRIVRSHAAKDTGLTELILALDAPQRAGDFVTVTLTATHGEPVPAIPRNALLRSAGGTFVYVVTHEAFLRMPVKTGVEAAAFIEITEGPPAGSEVVTHPVEQLWLTELRFTKSGGHSH